MINTIDATEVDRFRQIATEWWDRNGKFSPLHKQTPARLKFIRDTIIRHYGLVESKIKPLEKVTILDIGCGGGIISEPLARIGAQVLGIDPCLENIETARSHAKDQEDLNVSYRHTTVEEIVSQGSQYDAIVCLEVLEHVPNPELFCKLCSQLLRSGGIMVFSTLNRNLKSYALAILTAEYVLKWLPRGTHDWKRFITPDELRNYLLAAGLSDPLFKGLVYNILTDTWNLSDDLDVNYLASTSKSRD
ncbi:MAG: bifunctional 2-polyprenyl-6-hydroxyphenol methylase/3-demethylubiquinol 3-O-methyltransferase UbiG [Hyphomicrobium sp.]